MFVDDAPVNTVSTSMQIDEINSANGAAINSDEVQAVC
jgi:hypothetical protein